jgi:hypothetical protein
MQIFMEKVPLVLGHVQQATAVFITLQLLMMGIMVPETC